MQRSVTLSVTKWTLFSKEYSSCQCLGSKIKIAFLKIFCMKYILEIKIQFHHNSRSDQFEALTSVQYCWWKPIEFDSPETSQAGGAEPQQVQAATPQCQLHHRVSHPGEIQAPVIGDIISCWQVERVVTPVFRDAVRSTDPPAPLWPLDVAVGVAVILHPLRGKVPELRGVLLLDIHHLGKNRTLHGHVHILHLPDFLHPRQRVVAVKHQNEAWTEAAVLLPPPLQNLIKTKCVSSWKQSSHNI